MGRFLKGPGFSFQSFGSSLTKRIFTTIPNARCKMVIRLGFKIGTVQSSISTQQLC